MKKIYFLIFSIFCFCKFIYAASDITKPMDYGFTFNGILGSLDKNSAQRGLQVFTEVCASCHGLKHLAYRNLEEIGYNKSQIDSISSLCSVLSTRTRL